MNAWQVSIRCRKLPCFSPRCDWTNSPRLTNPDLQPCSASVAGRQNDAFRACPLWLCLRYLLSLQYKSSWHGRRPLSRDHEVPARACGRPTLACFLPAMTRLHCLLTPLLEKVIMLDSERTRLHRQNGIVGGFDMLVVLQRK